MMNQGKDGKKVDFRVFVWALGVLLVIIGWLFTATTAAQNDSKRVETQLLEFERTVDSRLASIEASLQFIVRELDMDR